MRIVCPHCHSVLNYRPRDLLGRHFVCQNCNHVFLWDANSTTNDSDKKEMRSKQTSKLKKKSSS